MISSFVWLACTSASASEPVITTYDASGSSPQCSQGLETYMRNCVFGSDFYFYIVAQKPVFGPTGVNCSSLGRGWNESEHIFHGNHDPIFRGFDGYWHGGDAAFGVYDAQLHTSHDALGDIGQFLLASRDANPACTVGPGIVAASAAVTSKPQVGVRAGSWALPSLPASGRPAASDEGGTFNSSAVLYDRSGHFGQCLEAPYIYLRDCVVPSDFFSFLLMREPVLEPANRSCAELGYAAISPAQLQSPFAVAGHWRGGAEVAAGYLASYRAGHPDIGAFLRRARDANPACARLP